MNTYLRYALLRISLFLLVLLALMQLGAGDVLAVLLAAVISMGLSYVLMGGMRDQMVDQMEARRQQRDKRSDDDRAEDDSLDDASH